MGWNDHVEFYKTECLECGEINNWCIGTVLVDNVMLVASANFLTLMPEGLASVQTADQLTGASLRRRRRITRSRKVNFVPAPVVMD